MVSAFSFGETALDYSDSEPTIYYKQDSKDLFQPNWPSNKTNFTKPLLFNK